MADRSSAEIFGWLFATLVEDVPPGEMRDRLSSKFWEMSRQYDFTSSQMEADEALLELGLAHKAVNPKYPNEGLVTVYRPPPTPEKATP